MKVASLFSGIGGFELGMLQADPNTEIVFASEFDPDSKAKNINKQPARQIYRKNFGWWPNGDIKEINETDVPEHDILMGGFPCQDVSIAGKREGLCGPKSGMFYEIIRIVREKKPKLVFLENVKGLLSSNDGWDFAKILIELEYAGYWVEWQVIDTAWFLPQRRERVFIIGHLAGPGGSGRKIFPIGQSGKVPDTEEPRVYTLDANYYKGPAQQSRSMILCDSGQARKIQVRDEIIAPLRSNTGAGHNNCVVKRVPLKFLGRNQKNTDEGDYAFTVDSCNTGDVCVNDEIRRLTPTECEKLQGFPAGWTEKGIDDNGTTVKISDTQRYKTLGNAVSVPVIQFIFKHIMEKW